jgi:hypothetical protein
VLARAHSRAAWPQAARNPVSGPNGEFGLSCLSTTVPIVPGQRGAPRNDRRTCDHGCRTCSFHLRRRYLCSSI